MIIIRKATLKDGQAISRLLKEKYSFTSLKEARRAFSAEYKQHHFRIAEDDGHIVGLLSWQPQGTVKHGVVELTRFAIMPDMANPLGIKEELFDVLVAEADFYYREHGSRLRKVFSMIHADADHIKQFYLDKGMHQEALLKDHYYPGKDELVFSLFFT